MGCPDHPAVVDGLDRCWFCAETYCPDCLVRLGEKRYCAHCKTEYVRELVSGLDVVPLGFASPTSRAGAALVDLVYLASPWLAAWNLLEPASHGPLFLFLGVPALLAAEGLLYEAIFLARGGQTPGKMAFQIKVVDARGGSLGAGQAFGRALVRALFGAAAFVPLALDVLPALVGREGAAVHDRAAGTRVVDWR